MGIAPGQIGGLVLAGGRGRRMGGRDKGLQPFAGAPLVVHALRRLAPQVGPLAVIANRHLDAYRGLAAPWHADVWPDAMPDGVEAFAGPLLGMLTGLRRSPLPYLACVPCDAPYQPPDLVERLGEALVSAGAEIAVASASQDGTLRRQPVFCLIDAGLAGGLEQFLRRGGRKVGQWLAGCRTVDVPFADARAFVNINTADELGP